MKKLNFNNDTVKSNWDTPWDIERPCDLRGMKDAHLVSLTYHEFYT
jgi:hypothetical protein